jgi:hypothetical protein
MISASTLLMLLSAMTGHQSSSTMAILFTAVDAFPLSNKKLRQVSSLFRHNQENDDEEEFFSLLNREKPLHKQIQQLVVESKLQDGKIKKTTQDISSSPNDYLDDLTPPPVNFARSSILFSDNPSTKRRNNVALDAWKACRSNLPAFITGAWPWRDIETMDRQPLAALYNMMIVRLPVIAVAAVYLKQLMVDHHGLVLDFGMMEGPQIMNPLLVLLVLGIILL